MRIGVEEPLVEHLPVVRLEQLPRGLLAFPSFRGGAKRTTVDESENEQPLRRVRVEHIRHGETRVRLEDRAHPLDVRRLGQEVELALQRRGKVLGDGFEIDDLLQTGASARFAREHLEQPEVAFDIFARARPLDLHDDVRSVLQRRGVHLRDRPGRQGLWIDAREDVFPRHAQLLLHDLDDAALRKRRHVVLQRRQLFDERRREQIGPRRQDLTELAERRTELLERAPEAARPRALVLSFRSEQLAEPVSRHDARDPRGSAEQ